MMLNLLRKLPSTLKLGIWLNPKRFFLVNRHALWSVKPQEVPCRDKGEDITEGMGATQGPEISGEIFPTATTRVVPMVVSKRESVVLPFEEVPGPMSLKILARARHYLSEVGTQVTAGALTLGINIGSYLTNRKPARALSALFDEYGPVVRFVSPIGGDIVLLNNPEHIQNVFMIEGDHPVRSTLDCLEKYRTDHRNSIYGGLYSIQGEAWHRQRSMVTEPLKNTVIRHIDGLEEVCDSLVQKIYNARDYHDEFTKDLYKEINKWAFDCMGLLIFSKKFSMLETEMVYSQCDMSWLYHSLQKATDAIMKCESGLQLWKLVPTPAWKTLVKYCDSLDNLIGKHVLEADQKLAFSNKNAEVKISKSCYGTLIYAWPDSAAVGFLPDSTLINALLLGDGRLAPEDIATILMDMLLIGVNTISSSMSFLTYNLAKHQRVQKLLYQEIDSVSGNKIDGPVKLKQDTPYLQACITETLRLTPPIPVLTRILPKNITLDRYNIPRGTLIIMSTQDASLKESNFDDATRFHPERWLKLDENNYHAFASIPFGFGARKCLGQNVAETMLAMLTMKLIQKFKFEYHYGDIEPTKTFITRPNKPLKIRFIDRM